MFKKRRYIFTSSVRSDKGIMSSVCGSISLVTFIIVLTIVFKAGGNTGHRMGAIGFVSCLFGMAGLVLGIISLIERDTFRFFPRFGFIISLISCIAWGGVLYAGIAGI